MKFRIDQESYIDDKHTPAGMAIDLTPLGFDKKSKRPIYHVPGPHWWPMDDEAKEYCEDIKHQYTGEVPDVIQGIVDKLDMLGGQLDGDKLASALVKGLTEAQAKSVAAQLEATKAMQEAMVEQSKSLAALTDALAGLVRLQTANAGK